MIESQTERVESIALNTKAELFEEYAKQKMASLNTEKKLLEYENKVDKTIQDSKFRIDKYS